VVIAKMDATINDLPRTIPVKGFPTLMLFKGDGTAPSVYEVHTGLFVLSKMQMVF